MYLIFFIVREYTSHFQHYSKNRSSIENSFYHSSVNTILLKDSHTIMQKRKLYAWYYFSHWKK